VTGALAKQAEVVSALGATVICADDDRRGVIRTAAELGTHGPLAAHVADAGGAESMGALAAAVLAKHSRLDIAVAPPPVHARKRLCDYTDAEYDRVANLNLRRTWRDSMQGA
jgi:NAD(P)-dependent dehydrogenase (short-subunit alcohol dehydrogenase family)